MPVSSSLVSGVLPGSGWWPRVLSGGMSVQEEREGWEGLHERD